MMDRGRNLIFGIAGLVLLWSVSGWGQGVPLSTDTLRIVNVTAAVGDTGVRIPISLRNTLAVGGYGVRFTFNSTVMTARVSGNALITEHTSRTDTLPFFLSGGSVPQAGVVAFAEAVDVQQRPCPTCPVYHIPIGTGPVVLMIFDIPSNATPGTYNLVFQDDPLQPAAYNRYSDTTGFQLYAPVLANGTITITSPGGGPTNDPPVIASIPNQSVTEGETLTFNVTATDAEGGILSLQALSLPPNATFPTVSGPAHSPSYRAFPRVRLISPLPSERRMTAVLRCRGA